MNQPVSTFSQGGLASLRICVFGGSVVWTVRLSKNTLVAKKKKQEHVLVFHQLHEYHRAENRLYFTKGVIPGRYEPEGEVSLCPPKVTIIDAQEKISRRRIRH